MDNPEEFADLEVELKALRPVRPSLGLQTRLASELESKPSWSRWWLWASLPAAAAMTSVFFFNPPPPAAALGRSAPAMTFQPVTADNVLYAVKDEGYVTLSDGTPARRVRSNYVDTITWKNPRGNASLRWSVPREEIRVVPVNFQ